MRSIAQALEAYKVDHRQYPMDYQFYQLPPPYGIGYLNAPFADVCLGRLTTPIPYLIILPFDAFRFERGVYDGDPQRFGYKADLAFRRYVLIFSGSWASMADWSNLWILVSAGPDQTANSGEYAMFGEEILNRTKPFLGGGPGCLYDPTNGTVSAGDIVRTGP